MLADLYLCWAHYYDYSDNFEKAESVYQKRLDAQAQPIALLEQAHQQFGFSMSQQLLHKEELAQREFRSVMDERLAMSSLKTNNEMTNDSEDEIPTSQETPQQIYRKKKATISSTKVQPMVVDHHQQPDESIEIDSDNCSIIELEDSSDEADIERLDCMQFIANYKER